MLHDRDAGMPDLDLERSRDCMDLLHQSNIHSEYFLSPFGTVIPYLQYKTHEV